MSADIRSSLEQGQMSRFQWTAVAVCVMLMMLDGFDVLVMAFTASTISAEWKLTGAQLGLLFSAGLFGMAAGSLFLAPLGRPLRSPSDHLAVPAADHRRHAGFGVRRRAASSSA